MSVIQFESFGTWAQLLDHINAGYHLYYHAPLDHRPVAVNAHTRKDGRIRVYPGPYTAADPFTADADHLPRFKRLTERKVSA